MCLTSGSAVVEPNLRSDHEEADTRLLLHAKHAAAAFFNFCHKLTEINVKCWQICIETIFIGYHRNAGIHMLSYFYSIFHFFKDFHPF